MKKRSKRFINLKKVSDKDKAETIESILPLIKKNSDAKFDESIDKLLFLSIGFVVSKIVGLEFCGELYDWGNFRETTPIKSIPR